MTASLILSLILGGGLVATITAFYGGTMTLRGGKKARAVEEARDKAAVMQEIAPDYAEVHFRELVHLAGETTGHWLPGHKKECQVCIDEARALEVGREEAARKRLAETKHVPVTGRQFDRHDEEIIEKSFNGEIAIIRSYQQVIHDPSICQTCLDAGVRATMPKELVLSFSSDPADSIELAPRKMTPHLPLPF